MSIQDFLLKIKPFYSVILLSVSVLIIYLIVQISLLESQKMPIKVMFSGNPGLVLAGAERPEGALLSSDLSGEVIGSKTGKKYYFPWCGALKRVKVENRITFSSIEDAKSAGFSPAGNCKGLK